MATPKVGDRVLYRGRFREVIGFKKPRESQRNLLKSGPIIILQNVENLKRTHMNTADMRYDDTLKTFHGAGVELDRHEVALYSAAMGLSAVMPPEAQVQMLGFYATKDPETLLKGLTQVQRERLAGFCSGYAIKMGDVVGVASARQAERKRYKAAGPLARDIKAGRISEHEVSGYLLQAKQKLVEADLDWLTDVIRCGMTTDTFAPNFDTMDFVDDITNEITVGGYARQTLGTKAVNEDAANDEQEVDSADVTFTALVTGETISYSWINKQTGGTDATPADDPLIAIHDLANTPTNGGNIVLQVDTEGWFKIGGAPA